MSCKMIAHIFVLTLFITGIHSQIDTNFCSVESLPSNAPDGLPVTTPLPDFSKDDQFQTVIEKNAGGLTTEIEEFYDAKNNIGVAFQSLAGFKIGTYYNYSINEMLVVKDYQCVANKLNESYKEGPFYFIIDKDNKERIITAFGLLILGHVQTGYLGSNNNVRGIPVKQWQACYFDSEKKATLKITLSFSNKWDPAVPVPAYPSIPVQYEIEYKFKDPQRQNDYEANVVTQFRPGILIGDTGKYTRTGVYCPGKVDVHPKPTLPEHFSFLAHQATSVPDSNDGLGSLTAMRVSIDFKKNLVRSDFRKDGDYITEIHDQNTQLRYNINRSSGKCSVSVINPNDMEAHNPMEFFNLAGEPTPQFVGQKKIRGINCDTWIAPRKFLGKDTVWDWYFMATGWVVQESTFVERNEPVAIVISEIPKEATEIKQQTTFLISNFDQTRVDLTDFDIGDCEQVERSHFRFTITEPQDYELMKYNQGDFKDGVIRTIHNKTKIPLIRISKTDASFSQQSISVSFSLFEKSAISGNKDDQEISLADATEQLNKSVRADSFTIKYSIRPSKFSIKNYTVKVDKGSLVQTKMRDQRYVVSYYNEGKVDGFSDGALAGFIVGFTIIGLAIGFVGGVFLILKRTPGSGGIAMGGFLNPNFKAQPSA